MREIKFRGQRTDNKEWIIGDLCKSISGLPCIMPNAFFATREFEDAEEDKPQVISDSLAIGGFFPVIPETVGQYTGLKDKNGVEIYDGDIVNFHIFTQELGINYGVSEGEKEFKGYICFEELGLAFKQSEEDEEWFYLVYSPGMIHEESFEVIGNIHSNPELLK